MAGRPDGRNNRPGRAGAGDGGFYLVEVDYGVPLVVSLQVEVAHADLSEVAGMVFVDVRAVVVLQCKSRRGLAIDCIDCIDCIAYIAK